MPTTIWAGPLGRDAFHEHDVVFIERLNRRGTIVSDTKWPGVYGIEHGVYVEFESGKGLPGNDQVQWVSLKELKHD
jgi:hypothetical protein